jgi:hypothetical protein
MWLRALLLLPAFLFSTQVLAAQVIRGNLLDDETGKPIGIGTVTLLTRDNIPQVRISTDTAGAFLLSAARPGSYRLGAERLGFITTISPPLTLSARDTLDVEFRLSTRAVVLEPLVVTSKRRRAGPLADFDERAKQRRFGTFVTRADIEQRQPFTTTDLLRTIPGVQLIPRALGGGHHVRMRDCAPVVYIDGVHVRLLGMTIDDLISVHSLEGIEVYRGAAEAPAVYTVHNPGCGVILLWSRID